MRPFNTAFTAVSLACLLVSPSSSDQLKVAQQAAEQTAPASVTVLGSMQAEGIRQVINRAARVELIPHPQSFLLVRERRFVCVQVFDRW